MAQLNQAWDLVRPRLEGGQQAHTPPVEWYQPASTPTVQPQRPPRWGECDLCGHAPATPMRQRRITGALLFWRQGTLEMDLCRTCGTTFFRESQAHCMTKGWWGVFAFLANWVVLS